VALRYRIARLLKDIWAVFDRRPRITAIDDTLYLGGKLTRERLAYLRERGVRATVSLQEETLDPMDGLDVHLWLPSRDGHPPSFEQLRLGARFIAAQKSRNRPVYGHCHAGVGRAPTLCAAYLVLNGAEPDGALNRLRQLRPWLSMNTHQVEAVRRFAHLSSSRETKKREAVFNNLCAALAIWLAGMSAARAQNVSVRDFEVPISRASSLFVHFNYGYERAEGTTLMNDAHLGVTYSQFYESLPFAYSTNVLGTWSRVLGSTGYLTAYKADANSRVKAYFWRTHDFFGSLTLHGAMQKSDDQPASDVSLGIGYGRFVNATSLRKAVRIDDFLVAEGVTKERLPKETMLALAYLIEREPEYRQTYGSDTYKKHWYDDIEHVVSESGLLTQGTLGAAGILRIEEVLFQESVGDRFYGFDLTVGAKLDLTLPDSDAPRPKPAGDVVFRYARPIRWDTQIEGRVRLNTPFDDRFRKTFSLETTTAYLYELTNRVDFRADYLLTVRKPDTGAETTLSHVIAPSFLFYLENEVRLLATLRLVKTPRDPWSQEFSLTFAFKAI